MTNPMHYTTFYPLQPLHPPFIPYAHRLSRTQTTMVNYNTLAYLRDRSQ